ncbi:MAG: cyclase family protein [Sulfurimonas sp.]
MKVLFLSYIVDTDTPTYGNRNKFEQVKKSSITDGDVANDTSIATTLHVGTHIDMPYHFYENGQTIEDYSADYWVFESVLFVAIQPECLVIKDELISRLDSMKENSYEILIVKTGICTMRGSDKFWQENYGFHPDVYDFLIKKFPNIRVFGFDSISVSSFAERMIGREAHKRFLNPDKPILLLEDMDLTSVDEQTSFKKIIIAPLRISKSDGLPCTVFGFLND